MNTTDEVLGLDLSLQATGAVLVPVDWGGDWDRVKRGTFGYGAPKKTKKERAARDQYENRRAQWEAERLAHIVDFLQLMVKGTRLNTVRMDVCVEDIFLGANPSTLIGLARLQGAVALEFATAEVYDYRASEIRKLLLGTANGLREQVKEQTRKTLIAAGAPDYWTEDEYDAFAVANVRLAELGAAFYSSPPPTKQPDLPGY